MTHDEAQQGRGGNTGEGWPWGDADDADDADAVAGAASRRVEVEGWW